MMEPQQREQELRRRLTGALSATSARPTLRMRWLRSGEPIVASAEYITAAILALGDLPTLDGRPREPTGIRDIHQRLARSLGSAHQAEHRMMQCLSEAIWQAQRNQAMPDEAAYLACLRNLFEND